MTILFLTPRIPYPPYRGDKLKIWNLLRHFSKSHKVILATFLDQSADRVFVKELKDVCHELCLVPLPYWKRMLNCLIAVAGRVPFQIAYYQSSAMQQCVADLVEMHKPDIIYTHPIRMAQYTEKLNSIPKVLDLTDALSLFLMSFRDIQTNPVRKWLLNLEFQRMTAYEAIIQNFDKVLLCSRVDRDFIAQRITHKGLSLLYNGVDLEYFTNGGAQQADPYRIIFTGNMSYSPNAHAAEFFVKSIFPVIKARVPRAKFFIVGQNPPSSVLALRGDDVVVTGFVKDIRTEYLKSAVAVSPVQFGSGTLNKVLEPMALGIPVVSSPSSVNGLELQHGKEIIIASKSEEFAAAVISFLEDPSLRESIGKAGMQKIRARFGWSKIAVDLENMFHNLIEHR